MGGSGGGGKGFEPFEDKEIKFRYRNSPLFNAILANDLTEFQKALDSGMNVNARNRERWTPLYLAIDAQNPIMVRSLLEKGAKIDDKVGSQTPIMFAVDFLTLTLNSNTKDARDIVRILIEGGANLSVIDSAGNTVKKSEGWKVAKQYYDEFVQTKRQQKELLRKQGVTDILDELNTDLRK